MTTCWACSRDVEDDLTVRVEFEGHRIEIVCDECMARGDEGMDAGGVDEEDAA